MEFFENECDNFPQKTFTSSKPAAETVCLLGVDSAVNISFITLLKLTQKIK